jgi:hypothetical protein
MSTTANAGRVAGTTLPVEARMIWSAPVEDFFLDPSVARGRPVAELLPLIEGDIVSFLQQDPDIFALEDYYNLSAAIDITIDRQLVHEAEDQSLSGERLVALEVSVSGQMIANNGPGAISRWCYPEIVDELEQYADLSGDPQRFTVSIRQRRPRR